METNSSQSGFIQQPLPNSTAVLVLGIISIALCWCYGIVGLTAGILALALAGKPINLYKENPNLYTVTSYKNTKAGQTCAIIGIIVSVLYMIFIIIYTLILGFAIGTIFSKLPWENCQYY